jgi:hypothetical protein
VFLPSSFFHVPSDAVYRPQVALIVALTALIVVAFSVDIKYDYWFLVLFSQGRVKLSGYMQLVIRITLSVTGALLWDHSAGAVCVGPYDRSLHRG